METEWLKLIGQYVTWLITVTPLVIGLINYVKRAIKEKNWVRMINLVMKYMAEAESKLTDGADKKEWVLAMIKASAEEINYDIDIKIVSELIDELCSMSKVVNGNDPTLAEELKKVCR